MLLLPAKEEKPRPALGGEAGDDLLMPAGSKPITKYETDGKDRKKDKPKADK